MIKIALIGGGASNLLLASLLSKHNNIKIVNIKKQNYCICTVKNIMIEYWYQ